MMPPRRIAFCILLPMLLAQASAQDFYDESVIRRVDLTFSNPGYWSQLSANYSSRQYIKADLKVDGVTYKDVGVRFRGNTSYWALPNPSSQKVPFKIKLDEFVTDQKLQKYTTLNFNNNYMDPSWAREITTYSVFREFFPAPKCNYVHLYINGSSWGPYFNTQQINKAMLAEWFESNEGNRYRAEIDAWMTWTGTGCSGNILLKTKNPKDPWKDLHGMCDVLNNTSANKLYDDLPKVLDVDKTMWMHAGASVLIWLDSYLGFRCWNFYVCSDVANGRMVPMPWDTNNAFGTFTVGQSNVERLTPFFREFHAQRPLFTRLVANPRWRQRYLAHIRTIVDTRFEWSVLAPQIDRYQRLVGPLVQTDPKALYTHQQFLDNRNQSVPVPVSWDQNARAPGFQPFSNARTSYLRSHPEVNKIAPTITNLKRTPLQPTVQQDAWITAKVTSSATIGDVHLYYRQRGAYIEERMFDDGNHQDGAANDGVYGQKIPRQNAAARMEYYVSAESGVANDHAMTFAPRTASTRPPHFTFDYLRSNAPLVINEFMASNATTIKDPNGDYDDWVELHNTSGSAVNLGGMFLSDRFDEPTKWKIPNGISIPANGHLLFWCDGEPAQGPLHADLKLSSGGEWIGLFDTSGLALIDDFEFGPQLTDVSTARFDDGAGPWVTIPVATPASPNKPACGTRAYDARDPALHRFELGVSGSPRIGTSPDLNLKDGPRNGQAILFLSLAAGHLQLDRDLVLLLDGAGLLGPVVIPTDATGGFTQGLPIPNVVSLVGTSICLQVGGTDATGLTASNGLNVVICQ